MEYGIAANLKYPDQTADNFFDNKAVTPAMGRPLRLDASSRTDMQPYQLTLPVARSQGILGSLGRPMSLALPKIHRDVPHRCIAPLQHDLCRCDISIRFIPTFRAFVRSLRQFLFACMGLALGAGLARAVGVYFGEVGTSLEANMTQNVEELPKASIQSMLTQHPSRHCVEVQILGKHGLSLVAQMMRCLEMEVFPSVREVLVVFGNPMV